MCADKIRQFIMNAFRQLKGGLKSVKKSTGILVRDSASNIEKIWDRLRDRRICLGVTGFSGSGKSTFLTSFIHQLMHFPQATLPAFSPILQERILGVELHFPESSEGASFDYASGQLALLLRFISTLCNVNIKIIFFHF